MQDKKKIYILLGAVLFVALALEILFARPHYHNIWNEMAGADILIGFAGAWLLILLAKKIMAPLLQRREDYYEKKEDMSPESPDIRADMSSEDRGEKDA